jgi:flagellin
MAEVDVTRIAGNIGAANALNSLTYINKQMAIHQTRLATGKRINGAADDPAGLTIATKMLSRSESLKTALSNIGDAKNLLAVAESGLTKVNDILVQMRAKAMTGASDTMGTSEREAIGTQLTAYKGQIDKIISETKWNGQALLDGTFDDSKQFLTGADTGDMTSMVDVSMTAVTALDTSALDSGAAASDFTDFMTDVDADVVVVNKALANLGGLIGRLTFKEDQVSGSQINVEAAYNRIMNANMAEEQVNASKYQILQQTATAMLAQANAAPQYLLSLFR